MKKKADLKKYKALAALVIACLAAFAVLVFAEGPEIITEQVTGLKLQQKGFNITADWDEMDCRGYSVTLTCEGRRYKIPVVKESRAEIKIAALEKVYNVRVVAILDSGRESRPADADIRAEKLPNEVKANIGKIDGIKGEKFRIEAEGIGDISFDSDKGKVAEVDDKGKVKLLKSGHAKITVRAAGDGIHLPAAQIVEVNVYPKVLEQVKGLKVENISDSMARLSWEPVDFATEYCLMKKNLARGSMEKIKTLDGEETSVEVVRNTGDYAVMARAVVSDRVAEGKPSKASRIEGVTEDMPAYSSWRNLKTLNRASLGKFRAVRGDGNCKVPQSLSITDDCYVISYVNSGGSAGKLCSYRRSDGECVDITACSGMGHANGTTYDPNKDRFYVVKTHKSIRTASCSVYNGKTKKSEGSFNLPRVTSGIAYDESNNKYYLSKGNEIYVCDSNFKVEKFIHKKIRYNHAQDIGAYNGIVFVCTWVRGNSSYIDMYRASDGAYLGGYDVSFGEIESCVIDDGYLVILMNNAVTDGDCIYKTKERLPIK
ncbi:MAG: hypothetical protein Q4A40_07280 [Bacillota bacterium]|nr:hypothetical protein [Bacillota bacterium]